MKLLFLLTVVLLLFLITPLASAEQCDNTFTIEGYGFCTWNTGKPTLSFNNSQEYYPFCGSKSMSEYVVYTSIYNTSNHTVKLGCAYVKKEQSSKLHNDSNEYYIRVLLQNNFDGKTNIVSLDKYYVGYINCEFKAEEKNRYEMCGMVIDKQYSCDMFKSNGTIMVAHRREAIRKNTQSLCMYSNVIDDALLWNSNEQDRIADNLSAQLILLADPESAQGRVPPSQAKPVKEPIAISQTQAKENMPSTNISGQLLPSTGIRGQPDLSDGRLASIIQDAVEKKDMNICNQLEIPTLRDGCIFPVAVAKPDVMLCDLMSDASKMAGQDAICKAAVTKDAKYCDNITTLMDIGKDEIKATCLSYVTGKNPYEGLSKTEQEATSTSILTQLKDKILSLFGAGGSVTESGASSGSGSSDKNSAGSGDVKCAEDCGDKVCSNGKCVEPKLTILFVPFFWQGTNEEFDKTADKSMDILLNALPLKDCKNQVKVLKLHAACDIPDYSKTEFYRALFDIKKCAERYTTHYDYVIGLTNKWDSFFGVAGGFAVPGFPVTLATASAPYIPAHEIGHSFGLNEEYCAGGLNKILGKCGFDIKINPLKSEYGCRQKDSLYDNDNFPDCCTSDSYLGDECSGNVGISESKISEDIYNAGMYEVIDDILKNTGYIYNTFGSENHRLDNLEMCNADNSVKEKLNITLSDLKRSIDTFYNIQRTTNFEFGFAKQELDDLREEFVSKCLSESDICGCINKNSGYFYAVYGDWQDIEGGKFPRYPRTFKSLIKFNTRNIMTGPATMDIRSGPFEFSKPAYDYLSTLPEMQCPSDTGETPVSSSNALSLCEKISNSETKGSCIAIVTGDAKKCQTGGCAPFIAFKNKEPTLCETDYDKGYCNALAKRNVNDCDTARYKRECQITVASLNNDSSQCVMEKEADKNYCKALVTENVNLCENAPDDKKEFCALLIALSKKSESACEKARSYCITLKHKECDTFGASCTSAVNDRLLDDMFDNKINCYNSEACAASLMLDAYINGVSDSALEKVIKNDTKSGDFFMFLTALKKTLPMNSFAKGSIMTFTPTSTSTTQSVATKSKSAPSSAPQTIWWIDNDSVCWDVDKSKGNFMLDFDNKHSETALSSKGEWDDGGTLSNIGVASTSAPTTWYNWALRTWRGGTVYTLVPSGLGVKEGKETSNMHYKAPGGLEYFYFFVPSTSSSTAWTICAKRSDGQNTLPLGKYYVSIDGSNTWNSFGE